MSHAQKAETMPQPGRSQPFIIAVDGPAAGGKGTLAKKLSAHYRLPHLDTGLTYRLVAQHMLAQNLPLDDEEAAVRLAERLDFSALDKNTLSADALGGGASKISVMPKLRQVLVGKQRRFAENGRGAVLDGRDIGTVVCPQAQLKLYVVAAAEIRAERRLQEMLARGQAADYETILADLQARDARDSARKAGPMKPAADAHLLDTTKLSIEEAFQAACKLADAARCA